MFEKEKIIDIYQRYGFEVEEESTDYLVFVLKDTVYPGVDIIASKNTDTDIVKAKYEAIGMAANVIETLNLDNIELNLYKRFLRPSLGKKRLLKQYDNYIERSQTPYETPNQTGGVYEYIQTEYLHDHDFMPVEDKKDIVDDIINILNDEGPKLVIVEAPAGFGKTSTSYEILRKLCLKDDNRRPFLMELERERQANTFHYLMVSQMESSFGGVIRESIVIDNIKKGLIPVIIDGFDEFLGSDLDKGRNVLASENGSTRVVESILSTIADLLDGQTKIILTTRKTALFSTEGFQDWVSFQENSNNRNFSVDRFQILESKPENWLPEDKLKKLPAPFVHLTNPVLLAFLKYSDVLTTAKDITAPQLINRFFSSIYSRERTRQDIALSDEQQDTILRRIANYFWYFDITADRRVNVKDAILELNSKIIKECKGNSTKEELLNRLVNHAMLDRKTDGLIGFLNDFIFGYFLSRFLEEKDDTLLGLPEEMPDSYIEKVIDAARYLSDIQKCRIGESLLGLKNLSNLRQFEIERLLVGQIKSTFSNLYFENQRYSEFPIADDSRIIDSQFVDCVFDCEELSLSHFENTVFINCDFSSTKITGEYWKNHFHNCIGTEMFIEADQFRSENQSVDDIENNITEDILRLYKRSGGRSPRVYHISRIINDLSKKYRRRDILKEIDRLTAQKLIYVNGNISWILQPGTEYLRNGI